MKYFKNVHKITFVRNEFQLRKLDKERVSFVCEKKNASVKRDRLIEAMKKEKQQLQERLDAVSVGPHAQHELKVVKHIQIKYFKHQIFIENSK